MEKLWATVKEHPYLFGGVALLVLVYFLWPASTSSTTASGGLDDTEEASIADAAQSSAELAVAQDQVQTVGIQAAADQAISANNNAATVSVAQLQSNVDLAGLSDALSASTLSSNNALTATENTNASEVSVDEYNDNTTAQLAGDQLAGLVNTNASAVATDESNNQTQQDLASASITSQKYAQTFITSLERAGVAVPTNIGVLGGSYSSPAPAVAAPPVATPAASDDSLSFVPGNGFGTGTAGNAAQGWNLMVGDDSIFLPASSVQVGGGLPGIGADIFGG